LRELDFGPAVIRDRVTIIEKHSVRFDIEPSETHPGGSLQITIEEPEGGFLFLRFAYQTTLAENPNSEERAYIEYVKSAYHQSDVDCVRSSASSSTLAAERYVPVLACLGRTRLISSATRRFFGETEISEQILARGYYSTCQPQQ
jgi:hypothetical protein